MKLYWNSGIETGDAKGTLEWERIMYITTTVAKMMMDVKHTKRILRLSVQTHDVPQNEWHQTEMNQYQNLKQVH